MKDQVKQLIEKYQKQLITLSDEIERLNKCAEKLKGRAFRDIDSQITRYQIQKYEVMYFLKDLEPIGEQDETF